MEFLYTTRFQIEDGSTTINIPIEEEHIPNLNIQVDLVGSAPRTDDQGETLENVPPRPAFASGQLNLKIPPLQRTLSLQVTPDQSALEPGGETTLNVTVKDSHGLPVPDAELAVVVVDEAILALTNYQLSDPLSVFYAERSSYLSSIYSRANIILADPQALARASQSKSGHCWTGMGAARACSHRNACCHRSTGCNNDSGELNLQMDKHPSTVRSDFNPLATFAPTVRTGFNGEARVSIKLPDNLTRYRIMVVAVDNGGKSIWHRRVKSHGETAAHGASICAALPQLWRQI